MSTAVVIPMEQDLEIRALSVPDQAKTIHLADQSSYERACRFLTDVIAPMRREVEVTFDPICKKLNDAHKEATAQRKRHLSPIEEAETLLKQQIGDYQLLRLREQQEAERLAQEEQDRLVAEATEAALEAAESKGASVEEIRAIVNQPVAMPRPVVAQTIQRAANVSVRQTFKATVTDIKALCRAIADGRCSSNLVTPNESAINAMARAQGSDLERFIPGIKVFVQGSVAARRK